MSKEVNGLYVHEHNPWVSQFCLRLIVSVCYNLTKFLKSPLGLLTMLFIAKSARSTSYL